VFTVVGMFKSEALIFWIFWVYVVRRLDYFEVKSLHHLLATLLQLIIVTFFCQTATGQTQLHYM